MHRLLLSMLAFLFFACNTGMKQAEPKTVTPYTYPLPKLFDACRDTGLISDHFYLIGWSEDGKLAYVNEPGDEACGCYFMDLYVLDAAQNKAVYHYHFTDEDRVDTAAANETLAGVWKQQEKMFTDTLNHYGIIPGNFSATKGDVHDANGKKLHAVLHMTIKDNTDWAVPTITDYSVLLQGKGAEIPVYVSTADEKNAPLLHLASAAVITDSSGRYAATLVAREFRGWEGPPNTFRYEVYACPLQ